MRKDSAIIVGVSVLLTAGIIGGVHFLAGRNASASIPVEPQAESARASDFEPAFRGADVSAETPHALAVVV